MFAREMLNDIVMTGSLPIFKECVKKNVRDTEMAFSLDGRYPLVMHA